MWAGNTLVYTCILILQRELERRHGEGGTCSTLEYICILIHQRELEMRQREGCTCSTLEYICILIHQRELERRQGECVGLQHTRVHLYTHSHRGDNEEGGGISLLFTCIPIQIGEIMRRCKGGGYHTIVHLYTHSDRG